MKCTVIRCFRLCRYSFMQFGILIVLMMISLPYWASYADVYELVKQPTDSRGFPLTSPNVPGICAAYLKNLQSLSHNSPPVACERPINPEFTDFSKPKWKELNVREHLELVKKIDIHLWFRYASEKFNEVEWLKKTEQHIQEGRITISTASIDIDADGVLNEVLRYDYGGRCEPATEEIWFKSGQGIQHFILNNDKSEFREIRGLGQGSRDLFIYKGRVYFERFFGDLNLTTGRVYVY